MVEYKGRRMTRNYENVGLYLSNLGQHYTACQSQIEHSSKIINSKFKELMTDWDEGSISKDVLFVYLKELKVFLTKHPEIQHPNFNKDEIQAAVAKYLG